VTVKIFPEDGMEGKEWRERNGGKEWRESKG